jgi:hypothetical protein
MCRWDSIRLESLFKSFGPYGHLPGHWTAVVFFLFDSAILSRLRALQKLSFVSIIDLLDKKLKPFFAKIKMRQIVILFKKFIWMQMGRFPLPPRSICG